MKHPRVLSTFAGVRGFLPPRNNQTHTPPVKVDLPFSAPIIRLRSFSKSLSVLAIFWESASERMEEVQLENFEAYTTCRVFQPSTQTNLSLSLIK